MSGVYERIDTMKFVYESACPHCGQNIILEKRPTAGEKVNCPHCKNKVDLAYHDNLARESLNALLRKISLWVSALFVIAVVLFLPDGVLGKDGLTQIASLLKVLVFSKIAKHLWRYGIGKESGIF